MGTSRAVEWLWLHTSSAGIMGSFTGWEIKVPHVTWPKKKKKIKMLFVSLLVARELFFCSICSEFRLHYRLNKLSCVGQGTHPTTIYNTFLGANAVSSTQSVFKWTTGASPVCQLGTAFRSLTVLPGPGSVMKSSCVWLTTLNLSSQNAVSLFSLSISCLRASDQSRSLQALCTWL